jgi:tRNA dimethylallyltransferase
VDPGGALAARIEQRYDAMVAAGWADEVEALARSVDPDAPAWKASGYSMMRELTAGRITPETARHRVIIETRQYAKRQRTWFRHQLEPELTTRVNPDDAASLGLARAWWTAAGGPAR